MQTTRRSLILAVAAGAAAGPALAQAALAPVDQQLGARATAYLDGLARAKARFVQTDARGQTSQGTVWLKRPGKARFAYDPPSGLLVVSDGGAGAVADSRLKTFDKYPLMATPLSLFLAKTIRFDRGVQVTDVSRAADGLRLPPPRAARPPPARRPDRAPLPRQSARTGRLDGHRRSAAHHPRRSDRAFT